MKKILLSLSLILGLSVPVSSPAYAIFGLSTCEKAKKAISEEEKIGLEFHRKYAEQRRIVLSMSSPTWTNMSDLLSWLPDVYDSDLRVFKIVDKNVSCFTTKDIARARSEARSSNKSIKDIAEIRNMVIKSPRLQNMILKQESIEFIRKLYPGYFTFIGNKKLV